MAGSTSRSSATASGRLACQAVADAADLAVHFRIRHQVFAVEQNPFAGTGDRDVHDDDPVTRAPEQALLHDEDLVPDPEMDREFLGARYGVTGQPPASGC